MQGKDLDRESIQLIAITNIPAKETEKEIILEIAIETILEKAMVKGMQDIQEIREIIMIMVSTLMNVLTAMVFIVVLVELQFLLNTDLSGMRMKVQKWLNSTKRESGKNEKEKEKWEETASTVLT